MGVCPPEIISATVECLEGDYPTLFRLSITTKFIHCDAQRLLYKNLSIWSSGVTDGTWGEPIIVGPPPDVLLDNPSLAQHVRSITYLEALFFDPLESIRTVLSAPYAHNLINLRYLHVEFGFPAPNRFLSSAFQLEELVMDDPDTVLFSEDDQIMDQLHNQKQLKVLRITSAFDKALLLTSPDFWCPDLHTLEASSAVVADFLPSRRILRLSWESGQDDRDSSSEDLCEDPQDISEDLARSLNELLVLRYVLHNEVPPLSVIAKHLKNLEHLVLEFEHPTSPDTQDNNLPDDVLSGLSTLSTHLRTLTLTPSVPSDNPFSAAALQSIFLQCASLKYINVETKRRSWRDRDLVKWVQEPGHGVKAVELVKCTNLIDS